MERRLHLFWPLTLIAAGVLWMLIQAGTIPAANLWALTYLWPLLLVAAGLGLILKAYWRFAGPALSALVVAILFLSVIFAGQLGWNRVPSYSIEGTSFLSVGAERGSGHVVTQNRPVEGFSRIHISYPADVLIRQGTLESLTIEAEDNVAASIRTRVSNDVLEIDGVPGQNVFVTPTRPVNVTITAKDLRDLVLDSAGQVTVQGLKTDALSTNLNGAGSMTFDNLQIKSLDANLSGVGSLHASGTATSVNCRVDGMGSFDGEALHSQSAVVALDGLGSATVWVDSSLNAQVNGLGSVNYFGNPQQLSKSVNGLGTVHYMGAK